jgi:hypothetical protein
MQQPEESVAPGDPLVNSQPGFLANVAVDHADGSYRQGDRLKVRFKVEQDAHVYLLYHQADNTTVLLFPNRAHPSNRLKAEEEISIPGPDESFRFRVSPPFGDEALQVIGSTQPIVELDGLQTNSGAPLVPKQTLDLLAERIAKQPVEFGEHRVSLHTQPREAPAAPARKPSRFALVIGLNRYQDAESSSEHEEAKRSAVRMAETFQNRCGVPTENTRLITDEQSTRANIEEAFTRWLPSATRPGDTVFVFYVGHGSQVTSLDPKRSDAMESYLTVYDNDSGQLRTQAELEAWVRERMILESTMARWLQELPGRQIVLMLEACRSGGFAASKGAQRPWTYFLDQSARVKGISQLGTIVICACAADENDRFTTGSDAVSWMPYFLIQAMDQLPAPLTVQQAFTFYQQGVKSRLADIEQAGEQLPLMTDNLILSIELVPKAE